MKDILKLARIQLLIIPIFIFFKLIRPSVLNSSSPEVFKMILLSLPNFFEGIIGILILTGIGLLLNNKLNKKLQLGIGTVYKLAVVLAGIYTITQELNIHSLGGKNIIDTNDIIFSVIGLVVGYGIILYIKPRIYS